MIYVFEVWILALLVFLVVWLWAAVVFFFMGVSDCGRGGWVGGMRRVCGFSHRVIKIYIDRIHIL